MDGGYFYNLYFQFPGNILVLRINHLDLEGTKSGGNRSYVMRNVFNIISPKIRQDLDTVIRPARELLFRGHLDITAGPVWLD